MSTCSLGLWISRRTFCGVCSSGSCYQHKHETAGLQYPHLQVQVLGLLSRCLGIYLILNTIQGLRIPTHSFSSPDLPSFSLTATTMPLGWYLAQGLIPLAPSDSDDEEGPCELPDGRIVCGPHGFVSCGKCCTDYSFMDDVLSNDEDEDEDDLEMPNLNPNTVPIPGSFGDEKRRGTGRVFPTVFNPPSAQVQPTDLFHGKATYARVTRYIHRRDPNNVLIFTDGACLNNGQPNPKAGWAFVHGPGFGGQPAIASGRLENAGPFGDHSIQTSNRAELRAVIAALRFRAWDGEGFKNIVIATDSEYVAVGATAWARTWVRNGWQKNGSGEVGNKDMWEVLLGEVERWHDCGVSIQFWRIPRAWNTVADAAAKKAAEQVGTSAEWVEVRGICM
ncbi:ribonuclease H-like domain-containing protein [Xylaria acuta]|nr:ribonuclease H-like domain-containing protein [Xylaria acuta]